MGSISRLHVYTTDESLGNMEHLLGTRHFIIYVAIPFVIATLYFGSKKGHYYESEHYKGNGTAMGHSCLISTHTAGLNIRDASYIRISLLLTFSGGAYYGHLPSIVHKYNWQHWAPFDKHHKLVVYLSELRGKPLNCGSPLLVGSGLAAKGTYRNGV